MTIGNDDWLTLGVLVAGGIWLWRITRSQHQDLKSDVHCGERRLKDDMSQMENRLSNQIDHLSNRIEHVEVLIRPKP